MVLFSKKIMKLIRPLLIIKVKKMKTISKKNLNNIKTLPWKFLVYILNFLPYLKRVSNFNESYYEYIFLIAYCLTK